MEELEDDIPQAVAKLNQLTQQGELTWYIIDASTVEEYIDGEVRGSVFRAQYGSSRLHLYKEAEEKRVPRNVQAPAVALPAAPGETYVDKNTVLEISDSDGRPVWRFPESSAIRDLYSTVSYHTSGAEDLIKDLIE